MLRGKLLDLGWLLVPAVLLVALAWPQRPAVAGGVVAPCVWSGNCYRCAGTAVGPFLADGGGCGASSGGTTSGGGGFDGGAGFGVEQFNFINRSDGGVNAWIDFGGQLHFNTGPAATAEIQDQTSDGLQINNDVVKLFNGSGSQIEVNNNLVELIDPDGAGITSQGGEVDIGTATPAGIVFLNDSDGTGTSDTINMTPGSIQILNNDGGGLFISGRVVTSFGSVVGQNGIQPGSGLFGVLPTCTTPTAGNLIYRSGSPAKLCICTTGPSYCSISMSAAAVVVCAGGSATVCP